MVMDVCINVGGQHLSPGESMTYDARIRYWEEEWISQLLEEALRLKSTLSADKCSCSEAHA
jgi:hypothetical protein